MKIYSCQVLLDWHIMTISSTCLLGTYL